MTHGEYIYSYMRRPLAGAGRHNEINTASEGQCPELAQVLSQLGGVATICENYAGL